VGDEEHLHHLLTAGIASADSRENLRVSLSSDLGVHPFAPELYNKAEFGVSEQRVNRSNNSRQATDHNSLTDLERLGAR
jgi:hypothetical protein